MYLKRSRMARTLILALTLMGLACSDDDPSDDMPPMDGGPVADSGPDGGPGFEDGGPDPMDAGPSRVPPTGIHQPSAAGTAMSANHALRFSFGAPQPMGQSRSANNNLTSGPNASGR